MVVEAAAAIGTQPSLYTVIVGVIVRDTFSHHRHVAGVRPSCLQEDSLLVTRVPE